MVAKGGQPQILPVPSHVSLQYSTLFQEGYTNVTRPTDEMLLTLFGQRLSKGRPGFLCGNGNVQACLSPQEAESAVWGHVTKEELCKRWVPAHPALEVGLNNDCDKVTMLPGF